MNDLVAIMSIKKIVSKGTHFTIEYAFIKLSGTYIWKIDLSIQNLRLFSVLFNLEKILALVIKELNFNFSVSIRRNLNFMYVLQMIQSPILSNKIIVNLSMIYFFIVSDFFSYQCFFFVIFFL